MSKRKSYRQPGWERQPVSWAYSVAFKKPRSGRLLWVSTDKQSETEASKEAQAVMAEHHPDSDYLEYGISKTYWRHWGGYNEQITEDEYEFALEREQALDYLKKSRTEAEARRRAERDGFVGSEEAWRSAWWDGMAYRR